VISIVQAYLVEINAKLIIRSAIDPEHLPENIYSQITEFIHREEDLLDLDVALFALPDQDDGSASH